MKQVDHFSQQAKQYALHRPSYPQALFDYIVRHCKDKKIVWDCATGNGQAAVILAIYFEKVIATDISKSQLQHAQDHPQISYLYAEATDSDLADQSVDLITVAQALHWLDADAFWREVSRVARPGGTVACWGYGMLHVNEAVDAVMLRYYHKIVGPYWPARRRHIETHYRNISFPFEPIADPQMNISLDWTMDQLLQYFGTWSATQYYKNDRGTDPLPLIEAEMKEAWGDTNLTKKVSWPLFLKMGIVK